MLLESHLDKHMLPKSLRPLIPYLKKYYRSYVIGGICVLMLNGIWVLLPQVIGKATDDLNHGVDRHKILVYSLLILAVAVSKGIFQFLTRWMVIGVSREIEFDLRNDMFRHLETLSYSLLPAYPHRRHHGARHERPECGAHAAGPGDHVLRQHDCFTAAALVFMFTISPRNSRCMHLCRLPFASVVMQYFGRQIHERFEKIQAMFSEISARVQENFSGARVIRAYAQEESEIAGFETLEPGVYPPQPAAGTTDGHALADPGIDAGRGRWCWCYGWAGGRSCRGASGIWRLCGFQYLHGHAHVADHRAWMGDQHLPARYRFHGPHR